MSKIKSMTGYGSSELRSCKGTLRVSVRSVNRKGLEVQINLPSAWRELEPQVRQWVGARVSRGTLNVQIEWQANALFDSSQWSRLVEAVERAQLESGWTRQEVLAAFDRSWSAAAGRDCLEVGECKELQSAVESAMEQLELFRLKEGRALGAVMLELLSQMQQLFEQLQQSAEGMTQRYSDKLGRRLEQLGVLKESDPTRWHLEVGLLAERFDIREELDRLAAHMLHARELLTIGPYPVGRKLDFLVQEMMREITTLMNKAGDTQLSPLGIDFKVAVERLREQLQNVE